MGGSGGAIPGGTGGSAPGGSGGAVTGGLGGGPVGGSGGTVRDGGPPPRGGTGGVIIDGGPPPAGGSGGGIRDGGGGSFFDAFPFPDSGPVATCVNCAAEYCADLVDACWGSPGCVQGVVCLVTSCTPDDVPCIFGCFGDPAIAGTGVTTVLCVAESCGADCLDAFIGAPL